MILKANYLMVTNGLNHYFCQMDFEKEQYSFLRELPQFNTNYMNKIAVVILNWNGEKLLQQFLPSIIQYSENATIYVADNASTDDFYCYFKT